MALSTETIEKLKKLAASECWDDDEDLMINDYAGGNVDDAYYGGYRSGEVGLAREILAEIEN
jgi:hypothetical protein